MTHHLNKKLTIAIVGGGITGLATAFYVLKEKNIPLAKLTIFEKDSRLGGNLVSLAKAGCTHELGAQTLSLAHPRLQQFIAELGLQPKLIPAAALKRGVFFDRKIMAVGVFSLLFSRLASPSMRLRALCEPFVRRSARPHESVLHFFTRRFGHALSEAILLPMLRWIWVGRHDEIEINAALPKVKCYESRYRSVAIGFIVDFFKRKRTPLRPTSIEGGLQTLVDAVVLALKKNASTQAVSLTLQTNHQVAEIKKSGDAVMIDGHAFDVAIVAAPLWTMLESLKKLEHLDVTPLSTLKTYDLAVVSLSGSGQLGVKDKRLFGVAFPRSHDLANLVFVHAAYPRLCAQDKWLMRLMYQIDRSTADEKQLIENAVQWLLNTKFITPQSKIEATLCRRAVSAVPLATEECLAARRHLLEANKASSNILFASSLEFGPSVGGCLESGYQAAKRVAALCGGSCHS